ncbi:MAG: DUF151 domain-containing protein [Gemmatimonadales bacterium]
MNITGIRENTYLAELLVNRGDQVLEVDARPSDSIALALRFDAPIFLNEELFGDDEALPGPPPDEEAADADALKRFLSRLNPEDLGRFQP